jgi:Dolichyl-phosphate-mannose-protein mannosyltransferase
MKNYLSKISPKLVTIMFLVVVLHLILAANIGFTVDEAHYALYAMHPALSYFDHPPLVGWLQIPLERWHSPIFVMRLIPEILWLLDALLIYFLAGRLKNTFYKEDCEISSSNAAMWALLAFTLSPLLHILGIGLLPDTLLTFFTLCIAHVSLNILLENRSRAKNWLLLGLLFGLAGLSKYTAILPAAVVAVLLLLSNKYRNLCSPWPYLAILIAALLVSPVFVWNQQHQWISFKYQINHGTSGSWGWLNELRFLLLQLLAYGVLPLWAIVSFFVKRTRTIFSSLAWFPFLFMAYFAGDGGSLPYWTAPSWALACAFAGVELSRQWQRNGWHKKIIQVLVWLQAIWIILGFILILSAGDPFTRGLIEGEGSVAQPSNPLADVYGWEEAGEIAVQLAHQYDLNNFSVMNWTLASRLAWYARPMPVHVLGDGVSQFTLWFGDLPNGSNTLLVNWSQLNRPIPIGKNGFEQCREIGRYDVSRISKVISRFQFYSCHRWLSNAAAN